MKKYISLIGLTMSLIFADGLDRAVNFPKEASIKTFILTPYVWGTALANLSLATNGIGRTKKE